MTDDSREREADVSDPTVRDRSAEQGLNPQLTRRRLVQGAVASAGAIALPGLLAACGGSSSPSSTIAGLTGPVVRGGTLRIGVAGGGSSETLDPTKSAVTSDILRAYQVFEPLVDIDDKGAVTNVLAEELSPNADATEWTIRVLPDVVWHNGKPLTADDVIYTFRYSLLHESFATAGFKGILPHDLKRLDDRTVRVRLAKPNALLPDQLSGGYGVVIQDGTTSFDHPIGTGPFKFVSWTRGERATYRRNSDYRVHDGPYLSGLEAISIDEPNARTNALVGGQVDLIVDLPTTNLAQIESNPDLQLVESPGSSWGGIYMFTRGSVPFADNKVRQALKLLINREHVVENALQGHAQIGNDVATITDPTYPKDLPQHEYDPEKAKALLKQAGQEDLKLRLGTADVYTGILATTTLFAADANGGGVTIDLDKVPAGEYFDTTWLTVPFGVTYFYPRTAYGFARETLLPGASQPETKWRNPKFFRLYEEILRTTDQQGRDEMLSETQRIIWNEGGYIIPAFPNYINAATTHVRNIPSSPVLILKHYNFVDVTMQS
jgi:peptide/nickel transport system substrate-binding protein